MNYDRILNIENYITPLIEEVINGERNALDLIALSKVLESASKLCKSKEIMDEALSELDTYSDKEKPTRVGFVFERKNSTKYDYSKVEAWQDVNADLTKIRDIQKEIESKSKQLNAKGDGKSQFFNELTGELLEVTQCVKITSTSVIAKQVK